MGSAVQPARPGSAFPYDAFISYSHAMDRPVATALQRGLHRLARPWYRMRALRVFRDDTSLSANPHLWGAIEQGLRGSRFFVLMASPESAASHWVRREVAFWRTYREPTTFLIVVTAGHIAWDRRRRDFDWSVTTALPRDQLAGWFGDEPLWLHLDGARRDTQLSLRNVVFRSAVCRLAAPLHGVSPDDLDSEDTRQYRLARRLRRTAVTALAVLLVVATALGLVAAQQRAAAIEQRDRAEREAQIALSRALAAEADVLAGRDPVLGSRIAVAAYRIAPTPQAVAALMRAVDRHRHDVGFVEHSRRTTGPDDRAFDDGIAGGAVFSPDGRTLAVAARQTGEVRLWDLATNTAIGTLRSEFGLTGRPAVGVWFTADGSRLVVGHPAGVEIWELAGRTVVYRRELSESASLLFVSPDGRTLGISRYDVASQTPRGFVTTTDSPDAELRPVADGPDTLAALHAEVLGMPSVRSLPLQGDPIASAVAPAARRAAVLTAASAVELWDLDAGRRLAGAQLPGSVGHWSAVGVSGDGRTVVAGDDQGQLVALDGELATSWTVGRMPGTVGSIELTADGALAVAVDNHGNVLLVRPAVDRRFGVLPGTEGRTDEEPSLAAGPDGRTLLLHRPGTVELWRLDERRKAGEFETDAEVTRLGLAPPVAAFSPDGSRFAVLAGGRVTAREVGSLHETGSTRTGDDPVAVARAFVRLLGGGVHLVRRDSGDATDVLAVEPDGERVVASGNRIGLKATRPGPFVAVSAPRGKDQEQPESHELSVWSLAGSRAERVGDPVTVRDTGTVWTLATDGRHLVVQTDRPEPERIALSGGGRNQLTGGAGRGAGSEFAFLGDTGLVVQHVIPDRDAFELRNRLLLWDGDSGSLLGEWAEPMRLQSLHQQSEYLVAVPGGAVLTVRGDGAVAAWSFSPQAWAAELCGLAGDLDAAQQQRYLPERHRGPVCR